MGDTLSKARSALQGATDFSKSVEKTAPRSTPVVAAPYSMAKKTANKPKPMSTGEDAAAGIHEIQKNIKQYTDVYPQ